MKNKGRKKLFGAGLVVGLVVVAGQAFTATNTVPASKAGDGSGAISGYTVSDIDYTLNTTNPKTIDSVAFNLAGNVANTTNIKVQLDDPSGSWYPASGSCTIGTYVAGTDKTPVTCTTTGATVASVDQLTVVAAD